MVGAVNGGARRLGRFPAFPSEEGSLELIELVAGIEDECADEFAVDGARCRGLGRFFWCDELEGDAEQTRDVFDGADEIGDARGAAFFFVFLGAAGDELSGLGLLADFG